MTYKASIIAVAIAAAALSLPATASAAAPSSALKLNQSPTNLTETVQWRRGGWGRCRAWRNECSARWGWGGPRFRRCMWRHGC